MANGDGGCEWITIPTVRHCTPGWNGDVGPPESVDVLRPAVSDDEPDSESPHFFESIH